MRIDRFYCYQCEMWIDMVEDLCSECYTDYATEDHDEDDYSNED